MVLKWNDIWDILTLAVATVASCLCCDVGVAVFVCCSFLLLLMLFMGPSVAQSSEQTPFTSEIVSSILASDS